MSSITCGFSVPKNASNTSSTALQCTGCCELVFPSPSVASRFKEPDGSVMGKRTAFKVPNSERQPEPMSEVLISTNSQMLEMIYNIRK